MNDYLNHPQGHKRPPMFYYPFSPEVGETIELNERETRHAIGARRLRIKEQVKVFDGLGLVATGEIAELGVQRGRIGVYIQSLETFERPQPSIHLACALPKGDRLTGLLDMATQLGMSRFTPLHSRYGNTRANSTPPPRWQRVCTEACKQSHRVFVPELNVPENLNEILARKTNSNWLWCADPSGEPVWDVLSGSRTNTSELESLTLMVGPEGGFSQEEVELIEQHKAQRLNLGNAILRIETAAVAMMHSANMYLHARYWCATRHSLY
ncbi:RsmE family RNA methyltransferase [Pseudomonadota bacterium]